MSQICEQATGISDAQYWKGFSSKIENQRIPFSGSIALTHRCNLGCIHCYAKEEPLQQDISRPELSTGQWEKIITEIKDAGCLYLLLTGGEPLVRDDFIVLYSYAKRQGFLVTVFTNGTLVTEAMADLFGQLPPRRIEITLYGASAATHDRITGVPGSFARCLRGIELLLDRGVNVSLKSVLMTLNVDESSAMEKIAQNYGVSFRLDAQIFPTLAGDRSALNWRVTPEQVIASEFANSKMVGAWREFVNRFGSALDTDQVYSCSAGNTAFHVDPYGYLYPCLMVRKLSYPLSSGSFEQGWNEAMSGIRDIETGADFACRGCRQKLMCGYCPGFFEMENGAEQTPSPYLCALGKLRYARISNATSGG